MENTLENKSRFFAQYMWQKVYTHIDYDGEIRVLDSLFLNPKDKVLNHWLSDGYYLELTPLSQITDEDAIYLELYGASVINENGYHFEMDSWTTWRSDQADYLRSKGYAVPWLDTTVEQQIEYGWVKLKNFI